MREVSILHKMYHFKKTYLHLEYSGTSLNGHPTTVTVDTHNITNSSESPSIHFIPKQPLINGHSATLYNIQFSGLLLQAIVNKPNLADDL